MDSTDWLTKREAAAHGRMSERKLDSLLARGEGPPAARVGRTLLFRRDLLDAWISEQIEAPRGPERGPEALPTASSLLKAGVTR